MPARNPTAVLCQWLVLGSAVFSGVNAHAETLVSGEVSLGYEYDSNVSVDELDRSSSVGDGGVLFAADISVDHDFTDKTSASASYGYSRIDYQDFEFLNRETHMLGGNLSSKWEDVTTSINYFYINARLDGNDFLTYHRVSPSLSGFVSKRWFLRGAYVFGDKTIANRPGRDAQNHGTELDAYYFWRGLRRYINLGYVYRQEESQAARFKYKAHQVKLRMVQRFEVFSKLSTLELGLRYEDRNYDEETPSIGERRRDERLRATIEFDVPLTDRINWRVYGGYSDYLSNLPSADYDQSIVGTLVELTF
ncbi:hypothetical protein N9C27_05245 [Luminiphilus sp.]|nr:hypothetical protein [Luminiphilus sp.]